MFFTSDISYEGEFFITAHQSLYYGVYPEEAPARPRKGLIDKALNELAESVAKELATWLSR